MYKRNDGLICGLCGLASSLCRLLLQKWGVRAGVQAPWLSFQSQTLSASKFKDFGTICHRKLQSFVDTAVEDEMGQFLGKRGVCVGVKGHLRLISK